MHLTLLPGPAGSGKTCRCLHEIREELKASPEGPALLFLAPRQATFQLESQLLSDPDLPGYTRLKIVSFDKLAEMLLSEFGETSPNILSEDGRVMVLRALLARHYTELKLFKTTARLPGFAQELSQVLHELQRQQITPERLVQLSCQVTGRGMPEKLRDIALLWKAYQKWVTTSAFADAGTALALATDAAKEAVKNGTLKIGGLWLDGFAELCPQELELLAAILPASQRSTLAFCLDPGAADTHDWFSTWAVAATNFQRCRQRLEQVPGVSLTIETLDRATGRFRNNPALAHLERSWNSPAPFTGDADSQADALQLHACPNMDSEAAVAAREILRFVQTGKGRFRETAVLVRSLEIYHHVIRRVFTQYGIPFFLDRRESISHHPLAELTRYALRLVTHGWQHDDWFGALKTGLVPAEPLLVDHLENLALKFGWAGPGLWNNSLIKEGGPVIDERFERLRQQIVPPFKRFSETLQQSNGQPTGPQLASALRQLWDDLGVPMTLEAWGKVSTGPTELMVQAEVHDAARQELETWLGNLEIAFNTAPIALADWLAVIDAGLGSLTVGIVPPGLDQVLVGAVDRTRNPDLKQIFILGLNETVFPAPPSSPVLLNEHDRITLASAGLQLGLDQRQQIGLERYLGYIACTRARERVVLTCARHDAKDKPLSPSTFLGHVQMLFPSLTVQEAPLAFDLQDALHASEVLPALLSPTPGAPNPALAALSQMDLFAPALNRWRARPAATPALLPASVEKLYGPQLKTSISDLEEYASCPFKFFVRRGLHAQERQEFEVDPAQRGSFQHEVLMEFHREVARQKRQWRDLSVAEARALIGTIGEQQLKTFREGLFNSNPERLFSARLLITSLQNCIAALVGWAPQYEFDPREVEIAFAQGGELDAWTLDLGHGHQLVLRGRIDRVDLHHRVKTDPNEEGAAELVVMDYKSSAHPIDQVLLDNGLDLQLFAYLAVLRDSPKAREVFHAGTLIPAGGFYVCLRGNRSSGSSREEAFKKAEEEGNKCYQHHGRFDADLISLFDNRDKNKGDQFAYKKKKNGDLSKQSNEALPGPAFSTLITRVEEHIRTFGREIYDGKVRVEPYRHKKRTSCDFCEYAPICRFDPWVQPFRALKKNPAAADSAD